MARTREDMEAMISQRLANDPSLQGLGGNPPRTGKGMMGLAMRRATGLANPATIPGTDPITIAMRLNNSGQPIPENLQRDVLSYASAQGMGAADLENMFGMPAGTVQGAVESLGIADQVPQSLGGNANFQPAQNPPPVPPDLARGTGVPAMPNPAPEQQQQMDQDFRKFGPNRPTGLQIPGFDDQGNRLMPGENNASIPRMLGPDSIPPQLPTGLGPRPTEQQSQTSEKTPIDNVLDFIGEGGKSDREIYREMVKQGVELDAMAQAAGVPLDEATKRYTRAKELEQIDEYAAMGPDAVAKEFPNGVPDNLIARYINETGQDDATIAATMDRFGVTPDDVSRATGRPLAEVQQRYSTARGDTVQTGGTTDTTVQTPASTTALAGRAGSEGQTGLAGAERAAGLGLSGANQAIGQGVQQARQDIGQTAQLAGQQLDIGAGEAAGAIAGGAGAGLATLGQGLGAARRDITGGVEAGLGALYQGLGGARTDLQTAQQQAAQQFGAGMGDITAARDLASQQVGQAFGAAGQRFDPYSQVGQQALQQQAALSGALGQEAFNQAFQESPQMQFLREQGERAALRTAAARGGVGGGNVMKELARFNTGLASQDLQRQIQNLQALGGQGLQATGQQAQLGAQAGQLQAGFQTDAARQLAAQRGQLAASQLGTGQQLAGLGTMAGQAGLGALTQAGQQLGQLGVTGGTQGLQTLTGTGAQLADIASGRALAQSQLAQGTGRQLADYGMTGALQGAQNIYGTGRDISAQRFRAGQDIASNIQAQMAALAGLQEGQGINQSNLLGQQAGTLAGIQAGAGQNTANLIGSAGQSLASAAMGQASAYDPANLGGLQNVGGMLSGETAKGIGKGVGGNIGKVIGAFG